MNKIIKLESVDQYNSLYGLETLHPLVSVVDLTKTHSNELWPLRTLFERNKKL